MSKVRWWLVEFWEKFSDSQQNKKPTPKLLWAL